MNAYKKEVKKTSDKGKNSTVERMTIKIAGGI
jgi:hypothetical protein